MASEDGKIRGSDLIDEGAYAAYDKLADKAEAAIEKIKKELKALVIEYAALIKVLTATSSKEADAIKNRAALADITQKSKTAQEELKTAALAVKIATEEKVKALVNEERVLQAKAKTEQAVLRLEKTRTNLRGKTITSYTKLSAALVKARNKAKALAVTNGLGSSEFQKQQKIVERLDNKIKKIDASLGQYQRNVGNYSGAIKGLGTNFRQLASAFGFAGAVFFVAGAIKNSFKRVKEFDQAINDLAGTMNVSRQSIVDLEADAIKLGATTKYTATQVAILQKQLAKKGFSNREILESAEAIIDLAVATGEDLAKTAEVTSATLRAMGLDTSEMTRVVNVMASSFTKTALDLEAFTESAKFVTPIARKAKISLEELTSLLGILADNGIKGSIAGTGLRKIISELDKSGKPLNERLKTLSESYLSLADATDEVGQRAQTSLLVLTSEIDVADRLKASFLDVGAVAKQMADKQMASLENRLILLDSAWDGIVQRTNVASGAVSRLNEIISYVTKNLESIINTLARVIRAFVIFKTVTFALNAAMTAWTAATTIAVVTSKYLRKGLKAARIEMEALNVATKANPWVLLASVIAVVATEIYIFARNAREAAKEIKTILDLRRELEAASGARIGGYKDAVRSYIDGIEEAGIVAKKTDDEILQNKIEGLREQQRLAEEQVEFSKKAIDDERGNIEAIAAARIGLQNIQTKIDNGYARDTDLAQAEKLKGVLENLTPNILGANIQLGETNEKLRFVRFELRKLERAALKPTPTTDDKAIREAERKAKLRADLEIIAIKRERDAQKAIVDDEKAGYDDRLDALSEYFYQSELLADAERNKEFISAKEGTLEREIAEQKHIDKLIEIRNGSEGEYTKLAKSRLDLIIDDLDELVAKEQQATDERVAAYIEGLTKEERATEESQDEIEKIRIRGAVAIQQIQVQKLEEVLSKIDKESELYEVLKRILAEIKAELIQIDETEGLAGWAAKATKDLEKIQKEVEKYAEILENSLGRVFENQVERIERELDANEEKYSRLKELAGDDENLKARLEKERYKKEEALRKKKRRALVRQAILQRTVDVARAGVNTAIAVTEALPNIPLAAVIAALGAIEIAAIIAAPLPKYEGGGEMKKSGMALVSEKRPEFIKSPDGTIEKTGNKPELRYIEKGSYIYPSESALNSANNYDKAWQSSVSTFINSDSKPEGANTKIQVGINLDGVEKAMEKGAAKAKITNIIHIDLGHDQYRKNTL